MVSKIQMSLCFLLAAVAASQAQSLVLPVTPCITPGRNCLTCNIQQVCRLFVGVNTVCNPNLPYCNAGECSATPTQNCAATEAATEAPEEDTPAAPEDTPAAPEDTPAAPEDTPAAPEDTPAAPEDTPVAPEDTPAAPEDTPAAPEDTPAAPEDA